MGRIALLLGFANAIIGAYAAHLDYSWYVWICVIWGVVVLAGIGVLVYLRRNPQTAAGKAPAGAATSARPVGTTQHDTPHV